MSESEIINHIYGAVADPGQWSGILTSISDHLGAQGGLIAYASRNGRGMMTGVRLHEDFVARFPDYAVNPWADAMHGFAFEQAVAISSLVDDRNLRGTAFYGDYLAPHDIADALFCSHRSMAIDDGAGGFGFLFSQRHGDRARQGREALQHLVPHLNRALDANMQLGRYRQHGPLEEVLRVMPQAAFLLDGRGNVLYANAAAESLVRSGDGLVYKDTQLTTAHPKDHFAFMRWQENALSVAMGTGGMLHEPLRLRRPSEKPPLALMPIPLPRPDFPFWQLLAQARLLLIVIDPASEGPATASTIEKLFGLSPAQARTAELIGAGLSAPQAAQALGLSVTTVRTHLARIFEKTGIKAQPGLVKLVSLLPVDAPDGAQNQNRR
jgi:DNA-binding CsgD family transcriptional regulator